MTTAEADFTTAWRPSNGRLARCHAKVRRLTARLAEQHGTPELGNLQDPLDEAIYILITYQTDVPRARAVFDALKRRYASWSALASADASEVEEILRPSGFQKSRCRIIRHLLHTVLTTFGEYSLNALRTMSPGDAERLLRKLPGLDWKGARCVALYSLGHSAFPVDSNTFRFMSRYGVLAPGAKYRRRHVHDLLQQLVPERDRYTLHVNLVAHGQTLCLPRNPRCRECSLRRTCPTGRSAAA
jgi:endonuclease III